MANLLFLSGRRNSNPRPLAWEANALPTELLPLVLRSFSESVQCTLCLAWVFLLRKYFSEQEWGEQDSNLRRRAPADLQSAPVGHFGISPIFSQFVEPMSGVEPLTCTLRMSCSDQLSYIGLYC